MMRSDSEAEGDGGHDEKAGSPQSSSQSETTTEEERHRRQALREARQVVDSMGNNQLDHFNLLGVVANPRGSQHGPPPSTPVTMSAVSSAHGNTSAASSTHSGISSYLDPYSTFEYTLSSVTEQIEALNNVFQDWSTQYLEEYYHHNDSSAADAIPESQLQELPPELTNLDLSSLEGYLRQEGNLAQSFQSNHQERMKKQRRRQQKQQSQITSESAAQELQQGRTAVSETASETNRDEDEQPPSATDLADIPEIFFSPNFDLTEPRIFCDLLLTTKDDDQDGVAGSVTGADASSASSSFNRKNNNNNDTNKRHQTSIRNSNSKSETENNNKNAFLEESTHDIIQILPPDYFTGYLDLIEVALLEQVREKSEAFFQETNRFAQLKEMVSELLMDVQRIRSLLEGQSRAIQSWQQVPQWDRKRKHLVYMENILEGANEVLRCKQCIGGLLSAKDDLGAVEQIQYARRLLAGLEDEDGSDNDNGEEDSAEATQQQQQQQNEDGQEEGQRQPQHAMEKEVPAELGRLQALKTVGEQLNQYESLVVKSLTEEVSEIFLEWNTSALASVYGTSNSNASSAGARAASQQEIQRRTLNIIESLKMCHSLSHMTQFYSTRLHDVMRMTVRTTVGEFATDSSSNSDQNNNFSKAGTSVSVSVGAMPLERFIDCLDMLFEQLLALLKSASGVDEFCQAEGLTLKDIHDSGDNKSKNKESNTTASKNGTEVNGNETPNDEHGHVAAVTHSSQTAIGAIVVSAAELSSKSIAELLRLRKEVHSMVTLDEIRQIWDTCMKFIEDVERLSGHKCTALRSMLFVQAKAFVERKHESNMSALVAALDSERWTQCEVSSERQAALNRLCTGRAGVSTARRLIRSSSTDDGPTSSTKMPDAEVEGIRYKVVWSCLLLVEMIMTNIEAAAHFQNLASNVVGKVAELLRLFNSRSTQLVLGAGAIHSAARLKSINAKHLSLVTQCLGMIIAILPHIRAALMAQLPAKQHTLLNDLDKIKKEFADHNEKVLNKFVTIIGGIVEHGLAKHIGGIDFDARAKDGASENGVACCVFLEGVLTNTRKMHQVLSTLLPPEHLQDVFSRIFAFLDQKIPALFIAAADSETAPGRKRFSFPSTDDGKKRLLDEVDTVTADLNALNGVFPWDFSAITVLAKKLEFEIPDKSTNQPKVGVPPEDPSAGGSEADKTFNGVHVTEMSGNEDSEADNEASNDADDQLNGEESTENVKADSGEAINGAPSADDAVDATQSAANGTAEPTPKAASQEEADPEAKFARVQPASEDNNPDTKPTPESS